MKRWIGRSGAEVFPIGLGGMPMSISGRPDEAQAIATLHAALDAGVDFIDTADVYCLDDSEIGHNERLIRKALEMRGTTGAVKVATKGGMGRPEGNWTTDGRPEHLKKACEASLRALNTDSIFLYQLHTPDSKVRFEDSVGALAELQSEGKIQHIGMSNVSVAQLRRALAIVRVESVQNRCNLAAADDVRSGLVRVCAGEQIAFLPYSPVGGHYRHGAMNRDPLLRELAEQYRTSTYCIALSWLMHLGDHVIPIPGASRPASILDSVKAAQVQLEPSDMQRLNQQARV